MKPRERLVVYGLLCVLTTLNVVPLMTSTSRNAQADPWIPDDLGPADALRLAGADGDLVVRNAEGRVSWGSDATARAYSMGFVDVTSIMRARLESEAFTTQRLTIENELRAEEDALRVKFDEFNATFGQMQRNDPRFAEAQAAYAQLQTEGQALQQASLERLGTLAAEQMQLAYDELAAAVDLVATRREIDLVLRFVPPDAAFETTNPDETMRSIQSRTALRTPDGLDLTDDVMRELGLTETPETVPSTP